MNSFAEFVKNKEVKNEFMQLILCDYENGLNKIEDILGASVEIRRTSQLENNRLRNNPLKALHEIQIAYLKKWRTIKESKPEESDNYLMELLLLVNAISGGLKGTG